MSIEEEVRAAEEGLRMGDASPDADTSHVFDQLMADDLLFVQVGMNSVGKSGVLRGHQPPRKRKFEKVEYSDVLVRELSADVALVACRTTYTMPDRSFASRTLRVWRKSEGVWRVAAVAMMEEPKDEG